MDAHLLTKQQVASRCGVSTRQVDRWDATPDHTFPKSIRLPRAGGQPGLKRWHSDEVAEWLDSLR